MQNSTFLAVITILRKSYIQWLYIKLLQGNINSCLYYLATILKIEHILLDMLYFKYFTQLSKYQLYYNICLVLRVNTQLFCRSTLVLVLLMQQDVYLYTTHNFISEFLDTIFDNRFLYSHTYMIVPVLCFLQQQYSQRQRYYIK